MKVVFDATLDIRSSMRHPLEETM